MEALMLLWALTFLAGAMLFQHLRGNRRGELTRKLGLATIVGVAAAWPDTFGIPADWQVPLVYTALCLQVWFAVLPLAARSAARRHPLLGRRLTELVVWSQEGRADEAVGRAALALGSEDAQAALTALEGISHEEAPAWRAVAHALLEQWDQVLAIPVDAGSGPQAMHVRGARVLALAELKRIDEARAEAEAMRSAEVSRIAPGVQQSMALLADLDIAAAMADPRAAVEILSHPLPQVRAAWILWRLGVAMDRAGRPADAVRAWLQAWDRLIPQQKVMRQKLEDGLRSRGAEPPAAPHLVVAAPIATTVLVGLIAVAYLIQVVLERTVGADAPFELGAFFVPASGERWRLMSYGLVHAGIVHAGMNAWVLWDVGRFLERRSGPAAVVGSFVLGVLGGSLLSEALMSHGGLVGASGGVLGVGGALLINAWKRSSQEGTQLFRGVGTWLLIIMAFSVIFPNVSIWGHLGGIIAGALFGLSFDRVRGHAIDWALIAASTVAIGWAIVGMVVKGMELSLW